MSYSHELSTKNNSLITNDNIASHATDNLVKQVFTSEVDSFLKMGHCIDCEVKILQNHQKIYEN